MGPRYNLKLFLPFATFSHLDLKGPKISKIIQNSRNNFKLFVVGVDFGKFENFLFLTKTYQNLLAFTKANHLLKKRMSKPLLFYQSFSLPSPKLLKGFPLPKTLFPLLKPIKSYQNLTFPSPTAPEATFALPTPLKTSCPLPETLPQPYQKLVLSVTKPLKTSFKSYFLLQQPYQNLISLTTTSQNKFPLAKTSSKPPKLP